MIKGPRPEGSGPLNLRAAMGAGVGLLQGSSAEAEAPLDARLFMAEALGVRPADVVIAPDRPLTDTEEGAFFTMIGLRRNGQSVARILGYRDFWTRRFIVTEDVLVPRPETESLIALSLETPFEEVLDLGTGSGCIALTLLAERPTATAIATDLSQRALDVAARNAQSLGVADRVHFEHSDWFASVGGRYDLIVSNPPYITEAAFATLAPEVLAEPHMALTPGGDGLDAYRIITAGAPAHLHPGGTLMVEIGYDQGESVQELFAAAGFRDIGVHQDLGGKDRVVCGIQP